MSTQTHPKQRGTQHSMRRCGGQIGGMVYELAYKILKYDTTHRNPPFISSVPCHLPATILVQMEECFSVFNLIRCALIREVGHK